MLATTALLYLTAKRLFGYWPAVTSCALFAGLGLTQILGRNAIYDAMSLMFIAAATHCAVRATDDEPARWLLLIPVLLFLADAAKYVSLIFNPIVILIAALRLRQHPGPAADWRRVGQRVFVLGSATVFLLTVLTFLAGTAYVKGILFTTLARKTGGDVLLGASPASPHLILSESWKWIGLTLVLAAAAGLFAVLAPSQRRNVPILAVCAVAGILVTVEALHLHSDESMSRHDDFGAWFACLAGGYVLAFGIQATRQIPLKIAVAAAAAAVVVVSMAYYSVGPKGFTARAGSGYNTSNVPTLPPLYPVIAPYMEHGGRFLLAGSDLYELIYNEHISVHWWNLTDDNYIKYPIPGRGGDIHDQARGLTCTAVRPGCMYLTGAAAYRAAISAHVFKVVSITRPPDQRLATDWTIINTVRATPGYVQLTDLDGGPTWVYAPR